MEFEWMNRYEVDVERTIVQRYTVAVFAKNHIGAETVALEYADEFDACDWWFVELAGGPRVAMVREIKEEEDGKLE